MNPIPYQPNYVRPFNNDRMGMLSAFRASAPEARARDTQVAQVRQPLQSARALDTGVAAAALPKTPAPSPTQLNDVQAESALAEVQQNANDMATVHGNLDADRVARLLGLLS